MSCLLVCMATALGLALPGCASVAPGNDALVVRAEQARDIAVSTFDVLLDLEHANREALWDVDPEIKKTCDFIRENEQGWINGITRVIDAYKANRTPEGKANLTTALATLEASLQTAQELLAKAQAARAATGPPLPTP